MAGETPITVTGALTADPELRFTSSGAAVTSFTVASNARRYDKQSGQWKDEPPLFMRCSVWREQAENVAESLSKGMRVIVTGNLKQRTFETHEGDKRSVIEMDVTEVGASMLFAQVKVNRTQRGGAPQSQPTGGGGDPWASTAPAGGGFSDEPPFFIPSTSWRTDF